MLLCVITNHCSLFTYCRGIGKTESQIREWHAEVKEKIRLENAPAEEDHRLAIDGNPYRSRYKDDWEEEIQKHSALSSYSCVKFLVWHMYLECSAHFKKHPPPSGFWHFYHDALSLMCAGDCEDWMKRVGIWKHWLLPTDGFSATGASRDQFMAGSSPECMPWDTHGNRYLHAGVNRHVLCTSHLPDDDPRKFSLSTPTRGADAYKRVLSGCPTQKQMVNDIKEVLYSIRAVVDNKGAIV